jgi:site-specific recombinase XerC
MVNGTTHSRQPSDFIKPVLELIGDQQLVSTTSSFTETDLQDLGKVLRRPCAAHAVAAAAYIKDS